MRHPLLQSLTLLLVLLLAACGGGAASTELTQTFTSGDGRMTLRLPADWLAADNQQATTGTTVLFANNRAALVLAPQDVIRAGQARGSISVTTAGNLLQIRAEQLAGQELTPANIIRALFAPVIENAPGYQISEPVELTSGGRPAATADYGSRLSTQTIVQIITVVDLGDSLYLSVAFDVRIAEREQLEPVLRAILGSVTYDPS